MYEVFIELEKSADYSQQTTDTHDHTISINQDHNVRIAILQRSACRHQSRSLPYPHGVTIDTELADSLLGQIQLLLQISSRAPSIIEIQLRIFQFFCQSGIFKSQAGFHALTVNQKILEKSRQRPQQLEHGSLDLPLLTHCQCPAAAAELESAGRNP